MNLKRVIAHTGLAAALMIGAVGCIQEKEFNDTYGWAYGNNSYAYNGGVFDGVGSTTQGVDPGDIWVIKPGGFAPGTYQLVVAFAPGFRGLARLCKVKNNRGECFDGWADLPAGPPYNYECPAGGPTCWRTTTFSFDDPNANYSLVFMNSFYMPGGTYVFRLAPVS